MSNNSEEYRGIIPSADELGRNVISANTEDFWGLNGDCKDVEIIFEDNRLIVTQARKE